LTSAHQNDWKTKKNINLKQRKNKINLIFFKNASKTQKTNTRGGLKTK
jgi:hypothetical protein